jgi:hypothetical protein
MDDHIGKHSAKGLRTDAQQTTANILAALLLCVFLLFSATEE